MRTSSKVCIVSKEDSNRFRDVGLTYVCQDHRSHPHITKRRADLEVFAGTMRYCGKHKRVAYYDDIASLEVCRANHPIATVQRIRNGNPLLNIKKSR